MARQAVIPFPACLEEGGQGTLIRHSDNCTPGGEPSRDAKAAGQKRRGYKAASKKKDGANELRARIGTGNS